jgi:hypothetical protein
MKNFISKFVVAAVTFTTGVIVATIWFASLSQRHPSRLNGNTNAPKSVPANSITLENEDFSLENQITEITLERKECYGGCPVYKVVLRKDGTAIYTGIKYVPRMGEYRGKSYAYDYYFATLAKFIESQGYFDLKDNYSSSWTDQDTAITSVIDGAKRKTVVNYGHAAPIKLWGIETAIDGIVEHIQWEKVKIGEH